MKADYSSYKRASNRSLIGLALQLAMGLALLLYGLYSRDHAGLTAAAFVLAGVLPWLSLAIVFDQHRRERIEAAEADAFAASDAASSSVFERGAQDLRVAAKRLKSMHKVFLPAISLLTGAILVVIGVWRFSTGRGLVDPADFAAPTQYRGWALGIGLGVAFVGFLLARYASGMARQKVWANLRAGAAFAVGAALMGLALAAGHFIDVAGPDVVLRYLQVAFPVAMVVLGAEVFLNFVLDLYRPRKAGEYPRPAFDSRVLGFVAAPDRIAKSIGEAINYQFGYDVSESWFYRLLSRSLWKLVALGLVVMWGMSSLVVVQPHQRGMLLRFGRYERELEPGLNFKLPWPIDTVELPAYTRRNERGRVEVVGRTSSGVRTLNLGTPPVTLDRAILWTNEHAQQEIFTLVRPGRTRPGEAAGEATGDLAMVAIEVPLHYAVRDVEAYERLAPPEFRDDLLTAVAQRELWQYASTLTVNDVLAERRAEMAVELRKRIEAAFAALNPKGNGEPVVEVLFVGVQGVHPPGDTALQFEQVVGAEQLFRAKLARARSEAVQALNAVVGSVELAEEIVRELAVLESMPAGDDGARAEQQLKIRGLIEEAGGKAASLLVEASAERWAKHMGERSRLASYRGQVAAYEAAPAIYRASLYLDALRGAMADARVYITPAIEDLRVRMELEEGGVVDPFNPSPSGQQ